MRELCVNCTLRPCSEPCNQQRSGAEAARYLSRQNQIFPSGWQQHVQEKESLGDSKKSTCNVVDFRRNGLLSSFGRFASPYPFLFSQRSLFYQKGAAIAAQNGSSEKSN